MMNALVSKIGFIALFISQSYFVNAHVALDYPIGGETFIVNEPLTIQWHVVVPHNTLNWDLFYSPDGGVTWDTIQLDIPTSQLSYNWVVPDQPTSQGRVRVIQDNADQNYLDISMDFTILPNTSPPTLDAPANDTVIECNTGNQVAAIQAWLNNQGGASATNFCGDLVWTNDFPGLSNDCGATGNALVTFTAEDDCGSTMTNATLTVVDTHAPNISVYPINVFVESNGQGNAAELGTWLFTHGGAQAADECSNVIWSNNYTDLTDGCGATGSAAVIFTVTDACGNSISATAIFTITDYIAPTLQIPAHDTTITCSVSNQQMHIQQWLDNHGGAQAYDVNGDVIWTNNYTALNDGCGSTGIASVIFTATDECGNSSTTVATITIEDTLPPVIEIEARDTTFLCGTKDIAASIEHWLNNQGGASASDLCGSVNWTNNFPALADTCGPVGSHNVIFTATDECGNAISIQAILTIQDSMPTSIPTAERFNFRIYPNPASETLNIVFDINEFGNLLICIFDAYGKLLWSEGCGTNAVSIPLNNYSQGAYFVQVRTSRNIYSRKVMIY